MNLLREDIEDIAERIKLRVIAKGPHAVFVKRNGTTNLYPVTDERAMCRAGADLVGSYTRQAPVVDIEDDLRARMREIAA
ncbi:hypothetical protein ACCQ10_09330 [Xanthomonas sp. NCPPB 1325]|uniref:hypothetical protein n=1 Tax=Xanthomonas sp. NCPPB 1325 TaxID=487529 RepID=UPI0035562D11